MCVVVIYVIFSKSFVLGHTFEAAAATLVSEVSMGLSHLLKPTPPLEVLQPCIEGIAIENTRACFIVFVVVVDVFSEKSFVLRQLFKATAIALKSEFGMRLSRLAKPTSPIQLLKPGFKSIAINFSRA